MKKFEVEHPYTSWSCVIEVDDTNTETVAAIESMVIFWAGWEMRLDRNDGDYLKTFIQQLGREVFYVIIQERVNLYGVIKEFDDREGWCRMDGSYGIKILSADDLSFDHDEFILEEVTP